MKARIFFLLLVLCCFFSCTNQEKTKKIMFIPKSMESSFWKIAVEGFNTATVEYNVFGDVRHPENEEDYLRQIEIVEEAIEEKYNAIVLSSIHYEYLVSVVEKALSKGIEVVIIDSDVNIPNIKMRVSTDNYNAGYKMGKQTVKDIQYEGTVGLLMFNEDTKNGYDRMQGYIDALSEYNSIEIIHTQNTISDVDEAEKNTLKIIEMYPDITALATYNEITTVGMGQAVKKSGRDDIYCIGFDNNVTLIDFLEKGIFDCLIVQNQFAMGYLGCEYAIRLIDGEKIEKNKIDTGVHVITKENMFTSERQTILFPFEQDFDERSEN